MSFLRTMIVLFISGFLQILPVAAAQKRVALVIGNSDYAHSPKLTNPTNDAADLAEVLKRVGFNVILGLDVDKPGFDRKIRDFARALEGADVALLFYAGHGLQVGGQNYLIPTDAKLESERDLDFEAISLNFILRQMEIERGSKTNIVFLDACRDNPLGRNLARSMGTRSTSVGRGLAQVKTGVGTFISYSTQPGNVALDGDGRNSPFSTALVKHIPEPRRNLTSLMIKVRNEVLRVTNGKQVPWDHSALTGDFYFDLASATGVIPKKAIESKTGGDMRERMKQLERELKKKSDPRQTKKMIKLAQARERVKTLDESNRQDRQEIFRIQRKSFGAKGAKPKIQFTREIGNVQVRMVRRSREIKTLRERIKVLEQELGVAVKPEANKVQ